MGNSCVISLELTQPIDVSSGDWEIGLIELNTHSFIPNIEKDNNDKFYYGTDGVISIPVGAYEIDGIEKAMQSKVPVGKDFNLQSNNNTLKCEPMCSENADT